MLITGNSKIKDVLDHHPELREVLKSINPKFKRLDNKVIFETIGRWARMKDVARVGGMSLCEVLYPLNEALGQVEEIQKIFPECIKQAGSEPVIAPPPVEVPDTKDDLFPVMIPSDVPEPEWWNKRESFEELAVINLQEDPFELIMKKAQEIQPGDGFTILQAFRPDPLINMLEGMGFEHRTEQLGLFRFRIYFYRKSGAEKTTRTGKDKRIGIVLQSATPVVWPVIMKLMQSERLRERIKIDELKVWDKTEKHLGWIVSKKADVSFSAVVAATRLFASGTDIYMASVDVWDNFHLLSRNKPVEKLEDLRGRTVYLPLIKDAPPHAVVSYLLKAYNINPDEVDFRFGKPFGRPEEISEKFISGEYETVLLREPEASYTIYKAGDDAFRPLSFADLWAGVHHGSGGLPNAGLLFKGDFVRKHPEEAELITKEVRKAVEWVADHKQEAAELAWDIMGHSKEEVTLFLSRVRLAHKPGKEVREEIEKYMTVLVDEGGTRLKGTIQDSLKILDYPLLNS